MNYVVKHRVPPTECWDTAWHRAGVRWEHVFVSAGFTPCFMTLTVQLFSWLTQHQRKGLHFYVVEPILCYRSQKINNLMLYV